MNSFPAIGEYATSKNHPYRNIDEPTLVINTKNNDFSSHSSSKILHMTPNSDPTDDNQAATKSYIDSLSENDRNKRIVYSDQDNELDNNKLTNFDSILVNTNPR